MYDSPCNCEQAFELKEKLAAAEAHIAEQDEIIARHTRVADTFIAEGVFVERAAVVAWLRGLPFDSSVSGDGHSEDMCPNCCTPWKCNGPHLSIETTRWCAEQLESGAHLNGAAGSES